MKIRYSVPDPDPLLTRIRIYFGPGSGSTFSKCGSENPDPLSRKGGSEDPDPLLPNVDPRIRIRIHVKMRWIRNAALKCSHLCRHPARWMWMFWGNNEADMMMRAWLAGWLYIGLSMTTNQKTENYNYFKAKNKPVTHFFKVRYTCTLNSGMEGSIMVEKKHLVF